VCATSRRNNLSIAPEHRTSCVALHAVSSGTVLPLDDPTAPRRVTSQLPVCVCVFGCTTWAGLLALQGPVDSGAGMSCDFAAPWLWQTSGRYHNAFA
jgi:hypothetical protein